MMADTDVNDGSLSRPTRLPVQLSLKELEHELCMAEYKCANLKLQLLPIKAIFGNKEHSFKHERNKQLACPFAVNIMEKKRDRKQKTRVEYTRSRRRRKGSSRPLSSSKAGTSFTKDKDQSDSTTKDVLLEIYKNPALKAESDSVLSKTSCAMSRPLLGLTPAGDSVIGDSTQLEFHPGIQRKDAEELKSLNGTGSVVGIVSAPHFHSATVSSASKIRDTNMTGFKSRTLPFCAARSTAPSHNITVNIQQVLSRIKQSKANVQRRKPSRVRSTLSFWGVDATDELNKDSVGADGDTANPDIDKESLQAMSQLKRVLAGLHQDYCLLSRKYRNLQKIVSQKNNHIEEKNEILKVQEALTKKDQEITLIVTLNTEVMALKEQLRQLLRRRSLTVWGKQQAEATAGDSGKPHVQMMIMLHTIHKFQDYLRK